MKVAAIILGLLALANAEGRKDYTGYKVISVTPASEEAVLFLLDLELSDNSLDFWLRATRVGGAAEVMVEAGGATEFMRSMVEQGMEPTILINNVQEAIEWEAENHERIVSENKLKGESFPLDQYHTLEEMYAWYDDLAAANDDITVNVVGKSVEGRDMKLLEIGAGGKPIQFFDCLIHAREWIAGSVCLWIIDQLANNEGEAATLRADYDFKFILPTNPDGYAYTFNGDRMWRKNRAQNSGSSCMGVDCNRNFDSHHCETGASLDPCSDTYCGPSPFSEPETQTVRDEMKKLSNVQFTYSFHSYSQFLLMAYGYSGQHPANYDEQMRVGGLAIDALYGTHQKRYEYGSVSDVIYTASGGSLDWYYDSCGVPYAWCYECRPSQGGGGFIIDESEILPNAEEIWAGIVAATKAVATQ